MPPDNERDYEVGYGKPPAPHPFHRKASPAIREAGRPERRT